MYFSDVMLTTPLGSRDRMRQDYQEWRAAVLAVRDLPEYKIRRLWKENYSVADIEQNKHYEIWPRMNPAWKPAQEARRHGRAISARSMFQAGMRAALRAMKREFEWRLKYHRVDVHVRAKTELAIRAVDKRLAQINQRQETAPAVVRSLKRSRELLLAWYDDLLTVGRLPAPLPIAAADLWKEIRQRPGLQDVSLVAVGRFLGEQDAIKRHRPEGNRWDLGTLAEARTRWEAVRGKQAWHYQGEDWQIGLDSCGEGVSIK